MVYTKERAVFSLPTYQQLPCELLVGRQKRKTSELTMMVSYGTWNSTENCFLTIYHSSFVVNWWVLVHCGWDDLHLILNLHNTKTNSKIYRLKNIPSMSKQTSLFNHILHYIIVRKKGNNLFPKLDMLPTWQASNQDISHLVLPNWILGL